MSGGSGPTPIRRPQPARRVAFTGVDTLDLDGSPFHVKSYEIVFGDREDEDRAPILDAARRETRRVVEREVPATAHHGVGFTVVHHGEDSEWLLVCWWTHECIMCQSLLHAERGSAAFEPFRGANVACIWELAVHAHERDAWSRHAVRGDADGWRDRYLADGVDGSF